MKIESDAKQREIRSGCKRAGKTSTMFSPRSTDTATKCPRVYIKTFGWPYVTVARDGVGTVKADK